MHQIYENQLCSTSFNFKASFNKQRSQKTTAVEIIEQKASGQQGTSLFPLFYHVLTFPFCNPQNYKKTINLK